MGLELFSSRIKDLRSKMGLTQKQFGDTIGITTATLSAYENSTKKPSIAVLVDIAEKFTVSLDWLCGLSDVIDPGDMPRKYSDIIKLLFQLEDSKIYFKRSVDIELNDIFKNYRGIAFNDPVIIMFLESWEKTYNLYQTSVIDETIYTAWKDKILKDFNEHIMHTIGQSDEFYQSLNDFIFMNEYDKVLSALKVVNTTGFEPDSDN